MGRTLYARADLRGARCSPRRAHERPLGASRDARSRPCDAAGDPLALRPGHPRGPELAAVATTAQPVGGASHRARRGLVGRALSYLFLVATHGWGETALVELELYGSDWEPGDVEVFSRISGAVLTLLVLGLLILRRRPRTGASLLALGALATPIAFWWAAALYVPIGLAVTAAGVVLARRSRELQALARAETS